MLPGVMGGGWRPSRRWGLVEDPHRQGDGGQNAAMRLRAAKAVGILLPVLALAACGHPGGDPNGTVLQALEQTTAVIPPHASNVSTRSLAAVWTPPCPEFPGAHAGWSADQVFIGFTASPSADVIDGVDVGLRNLGWHRNDIGITRGQGPVPHWTLSTSGGRRADVFAFQAPSRSGRWAVDSSWQPPGPRAEGCP